MRRLPLPRELSARLTEGKIDSQEGLCGYVVSVFPSAKACGFAALLVAPARRRAHKAQPDGVRLLMQLIEVLLKLINRFTSACF